MNLLKKYDISIFGLEDQEYTFEFEGGKVFFDAFNNDITGIFKAIILLNKTSTMIQMRFDIEANLKLICDRSLEEFEENIHSKERYFFKFGEKDQKDYSDEMEIIALGTQTINIAQHIYDFIALAVPLKRLHPSLRDENDSEEDTLVYTSGGDDEIEEKEESIDPRWAALMKLKN